MQLLKNDCFTVDGRRFRYLTSFQKPARIYVIDLDDPRAMPLKWDTKVLEGFALSPGRFKLMETMLPDRPHTESASDRERGEKRYAHVQNLLKNDGIFDKAMRGQLVRDYARSSGVSRDSLVQWLRAFWKGAQMRESLITNFHRSGRITETTPGALAVKFKDAGGEVVKFVAPARGRARGSRPLPAGAYQRVKANDEDNVNAISKSAEPPPRYEPYLVSDAEKLQILGIAWEHYGSDKYKSMKGATTKVLAEMYVKRDADGMPVRDSKNRVVLLPPGQRPTYRQIQRRLNEAKALSVAYRARHSPADYDNNVRPRFGSVKDDCLGPGDVYEIDATILDVHLVDRETRRTIIGKPTLYIVVDRWSRVIVGFHLSLDNPSWAEAKLAVMCIFADWRAMASRFRVHVDDRDLVFVGRCCNRFVADRGPDMTAFESNRLCDGIDAQVTSTRALRAVAKAIVESEIRSTQTPLRQVVPGYDPPEDYRKRRVKSHSRFAQYTLDMMRAAIFRIIVARNRTQRDGYEATAKEIRLGHSLAPLDIWQRGVETLTAQGVRYPYDYVRQKLLLRGRATVEGDWFSFRFCRYVVPEIAEWHVRARLQEPFSVEVSYESSLVDNIIIHDPHDSRKTYTARLHSKDMKWEGYSFAERKSAHLAELRNNRENSKDDNQVEQVGLYIDLEWMTDQEAAQTRAAVEGMTDGARKAGSKEALEAEKKARRLEAHRFHAPMPDDTSSVSPDSAAEGSGEGAPAGSGPLRGKEGRRLAFEAMAAEATLTDSESDIESGSKAKPSSSSQEAAATDSSAIAPADVSADEAAYAATSRSGDPAQGLKVAGGYVLPTRDANSPFDVAPGAQDVLKGLFDGIGAEDEGDNNNDHESDDGAMPCPVAPVTPPVAGGGGATFAGSSLDVENEDGKEVVAIE